MGFFSNLFRMRSGAKAAEPKNVADIEPVVAPPRSSAAADMINQLTDQIQDGDAATPGIWDVDDSGPAAGSPADDAQAPSPQRRNKTRMIGFESSGATGVSLFDEDLDNIGTAPPAPINDDMGPVAGEDPSPRARRNKTRLIGFETSSGDAIGLFEPDATEDPVLDPNLPVGWVVVTSRAGRGQVYTLRTGRSEICAGPDHAIVTGMDSCDQTAEAMGVISHDPAGDTFRLIPGDAAATVSLNGQAVSEECDLSGGSEIAVGATTMRFVALCADGFRWQDNNTGEENSNATSP